MAGQMQHPMRELRDPCIGLAAARDPVAIIRLNRGAKMGMPLLRVYVCGRLAVEHASTVLLESAFPARQGRRLWAYLVLNRRQPVGREDLAEAVWGDEIPDAWDPALNALISRLRTVLKPIIALEPDLSIRGEVGRYELRLPAGAFVDLERARLALHTAETRLRAGDYQMALAEARVAMDIAARGFLMGESGVWIEGQQRALRDLRVRALECTVDAELGRGNPHLAESEAEHLIALDPLHEPGYRLRMRAAAAKGNLAAVTRVMAECRAALAEHAGLEPSPETKRVYRELIRSEWSPG
jgi:DNA-binding SARP family transcriptional activator